MWLTRFDECRRIDFHRQRHRLTFAFERVRTRMMPRWREQSPSNASQRYETNYHRTSHTIFVFNQTERKRFTVRIPSRRSWTGVSIVNETTKERGIERVKQFDPIFSNQIKRRMKIISIHFHQQRKEDRSISLLIWEMISPLSFLSFWNSHRDNWSFKAKKNE